MAKVKKEKLSFKQMLEHQLTTYPARYALGAFTGLIIIWTVLLMLPISAADGKSTPFVQSLFMAVSTISVTGLRSVAETHWSGFGEVIIVIGAQAGGIGIFTLASLLGMIVSRRLGLRTKLMVASDTNPLRRHSGPVSESQAIKLGDIRGLLQTVIIATLAVEGLVLVLIYPSVLAAGFDPLEALWISTQYSILSFTNAGFSLHDSGIMAFANDYWFLSVLMVSVVAGAIGFPVIFALLRNLRPKNRRRWSLHSKLTLTVSGILIVVGALIIFALEWGNNSTIGAENPLRALFDSLFFSVMTRSGGFSIIDMNNIDSSTMLFSDILMFIGGGSASTSGGVKVTTFAVLIFAAVAEARGVDNMQVFRRRIPTDVLRLAVSVVIAGVATVMVASIIILKATDMPLDLVLFEVTSAFGTSGLSVGISNYQNDVVQITLAIVMWIGRVGTVTFAAALAARSKKQLFRYPEERPIVG